MGSEELFQWPHKLNKLEAERCPVPFPGHAAGRYQPRRPWENGPGTCRCFRVEVIWAPDFILEISVETTGFSRIGKMGGAAQDLGRRPYAAFGSSTATGRCWSIRRPGAALDVGGHEVGLGGDLPVREEVEARVDGDQSAGNRLSPAQAGGGWRRRGEDVPQAAGCSRSRRSRGPVCSSSLSTRRGFSSCQMSP